MNHYLLQQDVYIRGTLAIGSVPPELDPVEWIQGKKLPDILTPVTLDLSPASGSFRTDILLSFFPVFSSRLKEALNEVGVDNIDYYECRLRHPASGMMDEVYWLANVLGRIKCVDLARSSYTPRPSGRGGTLKQFVVDETATHGLKLFRLYEQSPLIVISEPVKQHLEASGLAGLYLPSTEKYTGSVGGSRFNRG